MLCRQALLAGAALVAFGLQTGILALCLEGLRGRVFALDLETPVDVSLRDPGAPPPPPPTLGRVLRDATAGRVHPAGGGRLADLGLLLVTLLASLVPVWRPQAARANAPRRPAAPDRQRRPPPVHEHQD